MNSESILEDLKPPKQLNTENQLNSINIASDLNFSIHLSNEQFEVIQNILPKGFCLEKTKDSNKRNPPSKPNKKIHLNDNSLVKIEKKNSNQNSSLSDSKGSIISYPSLPNNANRSLRQKHSKINYEKKFAEMETSPITSSMKNLKTNNENMKKAYKILLLLKKNMNSEPFLKPVDAIALNIPDYFTIIKEPMDLSTVERNLLNNIYKTHLEFAADVRKIWSNSFLYNAKGSVVYHMTCEMSNLFEKLYKDVEKKASNDNINELQKKIDQLSKELNTLYSTGLQKQPSKQSSSLKNHNFSYKTTSDKSKASNNINMDKPMTLNEKKNLGQNIRKLPPEYLRGVWEIVCEGTNLAQDKEELEFDIETLPIRKVRELERYVKSKLKIVAKANMRKNKKSEGKKLVNEPDYAEIQTKKIKENNIGVFNTNNNIVENNKLIINGNMNGINNNKIEQKVNETYYQMPIESNITNKFPYNEQFNTQIYPAEAPTRVDQENKSSDSSFITDSSDSEPESFGEEVV